MQNREKFSSVNLSKKMVENLQKLGYEYMTEIQAQSIGPILEKQDVLAKAKTGSGKTAAFGIGVLSHIDVKRFRVQSLILCPTRELAQQVAKELRNLAKFQHNIKILTLIGGESFGKQLGSLAHHAHIVVGTPGRVLKHLNKGSLSLDELNSFVLDEADRMLDMGFIEEIDGVVSYIPQKVQTLLFSATYDDEILEISKKYQVDPLSITTEEQEVKNEIEEVFVQTANKQNTLLKVLAHYKPKNAIVFVNTKIESDELAEFLQENHIDALSLHGDLEQYDRIDTLVQFSNHSCRVLIATDVASRGLDIKELAMVVNYDMANTKEIYTHRIGRTARAGMKGLAVSLCNDTAELFDEDSNELLEDQDFQSDENFTMYAKYKTLVIEGGKKDKLRAGDILGALTADKSISGSAIGKIDIYDRQAYVAIETNLIDKACKKLNNDKIKAKKFSVWILD
ncbi:ATP-dependent RNA helicase DbpA [Sulfurimonas marina]|uniref:ATP-dependent RNA helicase DbpA n=1 Tax=Sulfurimonas marina TaxID=2590551 RepID=A0A7M1AXP7_9BACT|nr:ATP-dependent RNA helicase DbpA [Sulfurimonas marina]QOP42223.1 ATP-dependent RNA helicase DbpA [Sulfurimonas marina]